jgi:hypothetical protein
MDNAETPEVVLQTFEKVLAQYTSFAVAGSAAADSNNPLKTHFDTPEQVTAASGQTFTTTSDTASKIRSAADCISKRVADLGEQVGKGLVSAGIWYRKRNAGKQTNVQLSKATMSGCDTVSA